MSRIKVRLLKGLVETIGVKSCWLYVLARPGFVEPSVFHFQYLRKWCFLQNRLCSRFWWWAWKQCYVFQSPCYEFKHSTSRKHLDLAVWLMTQQTRWISGSAVEVGHFQSVIKFHDIPFLRYIDYCIAPKRIASCKFHRWAVSSNSFSNLTWYKHLQVCDACSCGLLVCPYGLKAVLPFLWIPPLIWCG